MSSLSALKDIKMHPGVILKEYKNDNKKQIVTSEFTRLSGGVFKPKSRGKSAGGASK